MGKQVSGPRLRGKVGGLVFRQTKYDGTVVQEDCGPSAGRVKSHKNFRRTRLNAAEFKEVPYDTRVLRKALGWLVHTLRDQRVGSHMNKLIFQLKDTDDVHETGARRASHGDMMVLKDFDLNHALSLDTALPFTLRHSLDASTGRMLQVEALRIGYAKE